MFEGGIELVGLRRQEALTSSAGVGLHRASWWRPTTTPWDCSISSWKYGHEDIVLTVKQWIFPGVLSGCVFPTDDCCTAIPGVK